MAEKTKIYIITDESHRIGDEFSINIAFVSTDEQIARQEFKKYYDDYSKRTDNDDWCYQASLVVYEDGFSHFGLGLSKQEVIDFVTNMPYEED